MFIIGGGRTAGACGGVSAILTWCIHLLTAGFVWIDREGETGGKQKMCLPHI